ncbi:glutamate cyclase domain-containing protein [Paraburkholderia sediminicola]|uniref:glutamate cyclase domain-containing protein n=1 Tax=Paraburkholderia sediminicola TaxID=458836 RepID=UPI0038BBC209
MSDSGRVGASGGALPDIPVETAEGTPQPEGKKSLLQHAARKLAGASRKLEDLANPETRSSATEDIKKALGQRSRKVALRVTTATADSAAKAANRIAASQTAAAPEANTPALSKEEQAIEAQNAPAWRNLDRVLTFFTKRGIDKFHAEGGLKRSAESLQHAERVTILTGFSVDKRKDGSPLPETDGPAGAAALAHSLIGMGKVVTFITDKANESVLRASMRALNPEAEKFMHFDVIDEPHGSEAAARRADQLLDQHRPDAVVALELPSRNEKGKRLNMRGININPFNGPVDQVMINAKKRGITTIGIGDGGNEAGTAGLKNIPLALNGEKMAAAVPADVVLTAWNSNLGGLALGAAVEQLTTGKLDHLVTNEQYAAAVKASLAAGAVDGVTRGSVLNEPTADGKGATGVDGFGMNIHFAMLDMLRNYASDLTPNKQGVQRASGNAIIAAVDSGDGVLHAVAAMTNFLKHRSTRPVQFVVLADHGAGAYGDLTKEEVAKRTRDIVESARKVNPDCIAIDCNTMGTVNEPFGPNVFNVTDTTAAAIVEHGGARPAMLSTRITAESFTYPNLIAAHAAKHPDESKRGIKLNDGYAVAAPGWANAVNDLDHLATDKGVQERVDALVQKFVDQIPADATSVWLCCTHFPGLKRHVEKAMEKRGLGHVKVIDPIEYQANALAAHIESQIIDTGDRIYHGHPLVLTTGSRPKVQESANAVLGNGAKVFHVNGFGRRFSLRVLPRLRESEERVAPSVRQPRRAPATRRLGQEGGKGPENRPQ